MEREDTRGFFTRKRFFQLFYKSVVLGLSPNLYEAERMPANRDGKNGEARHRDAKNVSQVGRFKTSGMAAVRIV
jgi:hypothetical protein